MKNFTKSDLIKKLFLFANNNIKSLMLSSEKFICSPTIIKKNEIIAKNYKELMEIIFSEDFNKDINIIKIMTDASLPSPQKNNNKNRMNNLEKIGHYLKLFFNIETAIKFTRKLKTKKRQEIFLPKTITNNVYTIKPHQNLKIGPIYYNPNNSSNYSTTLFIKNNLTILYPIKIMGMGGSGLLEFYSIENDQNDSDKKIDKLLINIDTHSSMTQLEQNNHLIIKEIKIKNSGSLPVKIYNISIENAGCEGYGISLSNCSEINLDPKESVNLRFTIKPNYNFYLMEKNIIFHTHYHKFNLKININISDEILYSRNRLFNSNFGGLSFSVLVFIIILILLFLSIEYFDINSDASRKSITFISPKEIIEKNPILKIENLLLKTYRRMNKKIYDEFNIKQYTNSIHPNPLDTDKNKSFSSTKHDSNDLITATIEEKMISEDNLSNENQSENIINEASDQIDLIDQNKINKIIQIASQIDSTENKKNKTGLSSSTISANKPTKSIVDQNKPRPVGLNQKKVIKAEVELLLSQTNSTSTEIKNNTENSRIPLYLNKEHPFKYNRLGNKEENNYDYNYGPNSNYNQIGYKNQETKSNSIYNLNETNYNLNKNSFNKFQEIPYQKGHLVNSEIQGLHPNHDNSKNQQGHQPLNQKTNQVPYKSNLFKENTQENNKIDNVSLQKKVKEEPKKIEFSIPEKKTEAEQLREQYNNLQMGFKLGGDSNHNQQNTFTNPKTVLSENLINHEANNSSELVNSEKDEENNLKLMNLEEDESFHYKSEKEKFHEESGTEDKREDIKLNFNSIFGNHSNVKIITNDEKDEIEEEENTKKEDNNIGGLYFNEKFFTNFDIVFKKPEPFVLNTVDNINTNPFVIDNYKVSALNELIDDDDDKFKLDYLNDDKHYKVDELENDDDDKDPEWDDENLDLKNEGFFDETGTYKLKQIDFKFDQGVKKIKR